MPLAESTQTVFDAIEESIDSLQDEEILDDIKADGGDPDVIAEHVRSVLLRTVERFHSRA